MTLGEYLRNIRGEKTIGQIAQISGIDKGYLSKIERNERHPKPEMIAQLAEAYGTDYSTLMEICGYQEPEPILIRRIRKATEKMDEEDQKRMMEILKSNFQSLFDEEE
jgi:transcriptional regulator with XRE-family HTH domain